MIPIVVDQMRKGVIAFTGNHPATRAEVGLVAGKDPMVIIVHIHRVVKQYDAETRRPDTVQVAHVSVMQRVASLSVGSGKEAILLDWPTALRYTQASAVTGGTRLGALRKTTQFAPAIDDGTDMGSASLCAEQPCAEKPHSTNRSDSPAHRRGEPAESSEELDCIVYAPHSPISGFEALRNEWNSLLSRSRFDTIFLTHQWLSTWWEFLGEGDLWILAFRKPHHGELVGIVPLYLTGPTGTELGSFTGTRTFSIVGCVEVSDYLDIIAARGWEPGIFRALLGWLYSDDAPAWDVVDLCNLPQDSRTYIDFPPLAQESGASVTVIREDVAPQFALPFHYETYLEETVDKKQRHEIRRKQRRAEREADVGFHVVTRADNLAAEMDDFVALQQASREDKAEFMTPEMRRFFNAMAQRMMDAGWLQLSFLTLDGEKAAALLAFEYKKRYLLYNSGYDPDAHAHLSPGWVQLAYVIQYAIAIGCNLFDFMQGDEEYKYRFGAKDYDVMRVIMQRAP